MQEPQHHTTLRLSYQIILDHIIATHCIKHIRDRSRCIFAKQVVHKFLYPPIVQSSQRLSSVVQQEHFCGFHILAHPLLHDPTYLFACVFPYTLYAWSTCYIASCESFPTLLKLTYNCIKFCATILTKIHHKLLLVQVREIDGNWYQLCYFLATSLSDL